MKDEIISLINYRLQEAFESIEEAKLLIKEGKLRGATNRVYYSMFYAALALLAAKGVGGSKHAGVIANFHREFVKTGIFPKEIAKYLDIAFDVRIKGDYRDFIEFSKDELLELLTNAEAFVTKTKDIINTTIAS